MTEREWLTCIETRRMIAHLRRGDGVLRTKRGRRQIRLYGCACCRLVEHLLPDRRSREAIDIAEMFADGLISSAVLKEAQFYVNSVPPQGQTDAAWRAHDRANTAVHQLCSPSSGDVLRVTTDVVFALNRSSIQNDSREVDRKFVSFVRDIFANPFRPVPLDPRWLTADVTDIAKAIYDDRAFDRMPILADALMDAGCDSDDVIQHCRGPGPHVRGCWVVDLLLGKEG